MGWMLMQGTLTEGEGSVRLTSRYYLVISARFYVEYIIHLYYKTSYLHEEIICTGDSPSVSLPWLMSSFQSFNWRKKKVHFLCFSFFLGVASSSDIWSTCDDCIKLLGPNFGPSHNKLARLAIAKCILYYDPCEKNGYIFNATLSN